MTIHRPTALPSRQGWSSSAGNSATPRSIGQVLLALAMVVVLGSCSTSKGLFKARPANQSGFLASPKHMNPHPTESPFHHAAHSKSWEVHERAASKSEVYIAPVEVRRLRGIQQVIARTSHSVRRSDRPVDEIAARIRLEFAQAFVDSEKASYRIAQAPSSDSVTLEISLIELDPTSVGGNTARKVGSVLLSPLVTVATYGSTAGSIAIEGKIVCSDTGEVVFQFADREGDKLSLFSVKDFQPYGFIDEIIKEWASQFEEITRTPPHQEVDDVDWFTLNPL